MRCFVTGGTGFIGLALIQKLLGSGHEVVALVRKDNNKLPKSVTAIHGDIEQPETWKDAGYGCQRIYHLAAIISFNTNDSKQLLAVNGTGTRNILKAAMRWEIETTIVASSACTLGISPSPSFFLDESSYPSQSIINSNPYLKSKIAAEEAAREYASRRKVVIINPTTVYGRGDWTLNSGTLIKTITRAKVIPVPPGGSNVIDVEDVVEGIYLAGERGQTGRRYILGGHNLPFRAIFSTIAQVARTKAIFVPLHPWLRQPVALASGLFGALSNSRFITSQIVNDMFLFKYYSTALAEKELQFIAKRDFKTSVENAWSFYMENRLI